MRRVALLAIACAGVVVGILGEQQEYAWSELRYWLPDLLAGWTLIALGLSLVILRRPRRTAALLLVAGFSWFAFNFATTGPPFVDWLAVRGAYLHRAPLFQLALAPPFGKSQARLARGAIAFAWAASIFWPLWDVDVSALAIAVALAAVAAAGYVRLPTRSRRAVAVRGSAAAAVLAAAIAADAIRSLVGASGAATDATVLAYAAAVVVAGALVCSAALLDAPATLAERMVALGRGGARLRDSLRDLLGDPRLELGFVVAPGSIVDDSGRPPARPSPGQVATAVAVSGQEVATILHDPAALEDAETRSAVLVAVALAAERMRLQAEVTRHADSVDASRRRLLLAEEDERRRLAERLERGAGAELDTVERIVDELRRDANGDAALADALERAADQLARVRPELEVPIRGFRAFDARGLVAALERAAAGLPVETRLELEEVAVADEVRSALWFVCSECLANVVKHAGARTVRVSLAAEGETVRLTVEDDGRGGANAGGSGLVGLADRVAALRGRLVVSSPVGGGTRVVAELPLDR